MFLTRFFQRTPPPKIERTTQQPIQQLGTAVLPELIDVIIDHLRNDLATSLNLGLVSHQTLIRSRYNLFSTLEFDDNDKHFDRFLDVLDVPWSSFKDAVETLHIKDLFQSTRRYDYSPREMTRIAANLPHLKTLRLTSISWLVLPEHLRDFLFIQLNIAQLDLYWVELSFLPEMVPIEDGSVKPQRVDVVELFSTLQQGSIRKITVLNGRFDGREDLLPEASLFRRPLHFTALDCSLIHLLKDVWDPLTAKDLDITVDSFHLRLLQLSAFTESVRPHIPFISRFLHYVGPSVERLFVNLSDPSLDELDMLGLYRSVDLSQCFDLHLIYIGTIEMNASSELSAAMFFTMWHILSNLPCPSVLQQLVLSFNYTGSTEEQLVGFKSFEWESLMTRLRIRFANLKKIHIVLGGPGGMPVFRQPVDTAGRGLYLDALRQTCLGKYESGGLVSLDIVPQGKPFPQYSYFADSPFPNY